MRECGDIDGICTDSDAAESGGLARDLQIPSHSIVAYIYNRDNSAFS